jgi:hypothetical protein
MKAIIATLTLVMAFSSFADDKWDDFLDMMKGGEIYVDTGAGERWSPRIKITDWGNFQNMNGNFKMFDPQIFDGKEWGEDFVPAVDFYFTNKHHSSGQLTWYKLSLVGIDHDDNEFTAPLIRVLMVASTTDGSGRAGQAFIQKNWKVSFKREFGSWEKIPDVPEAH